MKRTIGQMFDNALSAVILGLSILLLTMIPIALIFVVLIGRLGE